MNARLAALALLFAGCAGLGGPDERAPSRAPAGNVASGVVFDDRNGNGRLDRGEAGVGGVVVSNGREVVRTDAHGRYGLPIGDETIVFVVKPRGWMTPTDENGLPRFFYNHKPAGAPPGLRYPGVPPTGPLPESIDFPLLRRDEPDTFEAIFFGDTQSYETSEIDHLSRDVIEELIGTRAAFGITLGDLVGDDLALFEPLSRAVGRIGIPWYHAIGNHDTNFRSTDDEHSDETFERVFGPASYAFQYGRVHFIVLDDVVWRGVGSDGFSTQNYEGGVTERQLAFVRNYLSMIPRDDLVAVAVHIPLGAPAPYTVKRGDELLAILAGHPRTISFSGHVHAQYQSFLGPEQGHPGHRPHHHINVGAVSGSWWRGLSDELGIPHATMRCGAPNGYAIVRFEGNRPSVRFKAARRPADYQLNIFAPDVVAESETAEAEVLVNVFAGSERSVVEMRWREGGDWTRLEKVQRVDPYYAALLKREARLVTNPQLRLPRPMPSPHIWGAPLPAPPGLGTHALEVRTTDVFGQIFTAYRLVRIEPAAASGSSSR